MWVVMINKAKFEEYCLFNTVLRKMPVIWSCAVGQNVDKKRWHLIATIIPIFFKKESPIFRFVIQSDHAILKYPDRVYFLCKHFFSYTFTLANSLFSLFRPLLFNISHPPTPASRKIMVRPLTTAETGWRNGLKPSSLIHFNDIEQLLLLIILFLFLSFWRQRGFQRLSCIQFFY